MRTAAPERELAPNGRRPLAVRPLLALMALFSGIALLLNILAKLDLRVALATMLSVAGVGLVRVVRRAASAERRLLGAAEPAAVVDARRRWSVVWL